MRRGTWVLFLIVFMLLLTSCQNSNSKTTDTATFTEAATVLEIVGPNGSVSYKLAEIQKLPSLEGYGGIKSSTGKITIPDIYKGISLVELANKVSDFNETYGVELQAIDGYSMTFSYNQLVNGEFITYDPGTGDETKNEIQLTPILAYAVAGQLLNPQTDGYLRLAVISDKNNQVVDGHWAVKWVTKVIVKPLIKEWTLHLEGALVEDMDRGTFESGSAPKCHGYADSNADSQGWTDSEGHVWEGIPLWRLVGRVDDTDKHEGDSFSDEIADTGYQVEIISSDGNSIMLDSKMVKRNDQILVAYKMDGNPLTDEDFPLKLTGPGLNPDQNIGQINSIVLHFATQ